MRIAFFLDPCVGKEYGIGMVAKLRLARTFYRNTRVVVTASSWIEHLAIASAILTIPKTTKGDVIECGSYKGGSAANLSLVCAIVHRKLFVCDSFEGLPEPEHTDRSHVMEIKNKHKIYEKGQYAGSLEEVRAHITRYGAIEACSFIKGYFDATLPTLVHEKFICVFLDVDLTESLKTCLTNLWPRIIDNGRLYSHEAQDMSFVRTFYDRDWWNRTLHTEPPGFIGAGTGLPLGVGSGSSVGYTMKKI